MPLPARGATPYTIRHGFGYSVFEHVENGLASELWIYVATDAPVKFAVCKVRNLSNRPRRLSVTGYWEWVLGELRSRTLLHVQTELEAGSGALLARNRYQSDFADRIAFVDVGRRTAPCPGTAWNSASGATETVSAGPPPCAGPGFPAAWGRAWIRRRRCRCPLELAPGQGEGEVVFRLGAGTQPRGSAEGGPHPAVPPPPAPRTGGPRADLGNTGAGPSAR